MLEIIHDDQIVAEVREKNELIDVVYLGEIATSFPVEKMFKTIKTTFSLDSVEINSLLFGEGVKEIAARAFSGKKIKKVLIRSEDLTTIGSFAFAGCQIEKLDLDWRNSSKLKKNKLLDNSKNGLKIVAIGAFSNNNIDKLVLPKTLEVVGAQAFANNDIKHTYISKDLLLNIKGNTFLGNPRNVFHKLRNLNSQSDRIIK